MITTLLASYILNSAAAVTGTVTDGGKPVKEAVVWLTGTTKGKAVKSEIVQKNKRFTPRILVVPAGSTVTFPNRDDLFHNVFAEYNAKKFDLGMYPKGETRDVKFDKPGLVAILCNVHSEMSAYIMVVDTPYFTKTDAKGKFSLANVPAGKYVAEAWHESGKKTKFDATVSGSGANLEFKISRR